MRRAILTEPPPPKKDAALPLGQAVIGRALGDPDMGRGGKLEPAADHRAVHGGDDRGASELDRLERPVPHARMQNAFERIMALGDLGKVEPGREMLALAGQHHRANVLRQPGEERLEPQHGHIVERVAFFRSRQAQMRDRAAPRRFERFRQIDLDRLFQRLERHDSSRERLQGAALSHS